MPTPKKKQIEHVEGCPDCNDLAALYTPERVRRAIRRIAKVAMLPAIGEEMISAIEKAKVKRAYT